MASNGSFTTSSYSSRSLTFSWEVSSQSIENNTTTIKWYLKGSGSYSGWVNSGNFKVTINGSQVYFSETRIQLYNGTSVASGSYTISHNTDGTQSFSAYAEAGIYYVAVNCSGSGSWSLPTIPRASTVSGGSGNIGSTTTISIARNSSSFTHTLTWSFGSLSGTIGSGIGTSTTWTIPTSLYAQIPNATSGTGTITCKTYSGSTLIGTKTCSFTASVVNSNPVFSTSALSYQDTNSTVVSITGNNQHIVRNNSTLSVSFTGATAQNSATISKYQITFNGSTIERTSASTIDFGIINVGNNLDVSVKVIDSRGLSTTISKTITIYDWVNPTAVITAGRLNNYEDETVILVNAEISSVNNKNTLTSLQYRYKKVQDSSYSDYISFVDNVSFSAVIDKLYAWNIQFLLKDKFGSTTYNITVPKGVPIMFIDVEKLSVAIGGFPVHSNSFETFGIHYLSSGNEALDYEIIDEW